MGKTQADFSNYTVAVVVHMEEVLWPWTFLYMIPAFAPAPIATVRLQTPL
jgi:hypothetical protein